MERAGTIHRHVLEDLAPEVLVEGMSELEFTTKLYSLNGERGHHGIVRFGMSEAEIILGLIGFGESSIYPTYLDSPGETKEYHQLSPCWGAGTGAS